MVSSNLSIFTLSFLWVWPSFKLIFFFISCKHYSSFIWLFLLSKLSYVFLLFLNICSLNALYEFEYFVFMLKLCLEVFYWGNADTFMGIPMICIKGLRKVVNLGGKYLCYSYICIFNKIWLYLSLLYSEISLGVMNSSKWFCIVWSKFIKRLL